jgi:hypothetical protein
VVITWSDNFEEYLGFDPDTIKPLTTSGVIIYDRDGNAIDTTDYDSAVAAMEREATDFTVQQGYVDEYRRARGSYGHAVSDIEVLETYPN